VDVLPELTVQVMSREATPELGLGPTRELLSRGVYFTALVCYNDLAAIGAARVIRDYGLRVPEDISLIGFDDIESASYNTPSLTTIRQPLKQMGTVAAHILLKRIRGLETLSNVSPILPELVIRESTCPPNAGGARWKKS
jgi:LacI family transcriptional regulator